MLDAWQEFEFSLTLRQMQRLGWMRDRIEATVLLADNGLFQTPHDAKRLVYGRYLVASRRLSEFMS